MDHPERVGRAARLPHPSDAFPGNRGERRRTTVRRLSGHRQRAGARRGKGDHPVHRSGPRRQGSLSLPADVERGQGDGGHDRGGGLTPMSWAQAGTVIVGAFFASLVEFVEALTIVLAVGPTRGWRPALTGAGAGVLFLTVLTLALGPALQRIPLGPFQLAVGVLLVLFGMRWLRKAILRAGGVIALHDEAAINATQTAARISLLTSFKIGRAHV